MSDDDPDALHPVFAYGSNLDLDDLARWLAERGHPVERPRRALPATLGGWRLAWNYASPVRRGGAANVEPWPEAALPGALLYVSATLLVALDAKEGHPERYRRRRLAVRTAEGPVEAWVYVVTEAWRSPCVERPRRAYVETILRGARAFGLPAAHIAALAAIPSLDEPEDAMGAMGAMDVMGRLDGIDGTDGIDD